MHCLCEDRARKTDTASALSLISHLHKGVMPKEPAQGDIDESNHGDDNSEVGSEASGASSGGGEIEGSEEPESREGVSDESTLSDKESNEEGDSGNESDSTENVHPQDRDVASEVFVDKSLSTREQKQQKRAQEHMRKRRVKKKRLDEPIHSVIQKTTLGKYIYKLPMTEKQENLVEEFYNDYLDSDVLGYRAKKLEEEEQKRLKAEEWEKTKAKIKRFVTGPKRFIKNTWADIKEYIRLYRRGKRKVTAKRLQRFMRYASLNEAARMRMYVKSGIPINYRDENGWTALHHGAFEGYQNIVRECIKFKCEIDPVTTDSGLTPFWMSIYRSDNRSGFMLLDEECDVDPVCPKTGMTPMHLCAQNNNLNMAERLIDEGAFLTSQDKGGWTPLHHAAYCAHEKMVFLLLDNDHEIGGARDIKDRAGNLPVDYALRQQFKEDCNGDYEFQQKRIKCAKLLQWGVDEERNYMSDDDYKYW